VTEASERGGFMELHVKNEGKAVVISVTGRMDAVSSPEFELEMGKLIDEGNINLVADFSELNYISSSGLRSVLATAKRLKEKNGKILITSLKDIVKEVFEVSGFITIIPVYDSVEEAMRSL